MSVDILILNTAVVDLRSSEFGFVENLVGAGGLAKCKLSNMPDFTQKQYQKFLSEGLATAGGPGNTAPLLAKAGIRTAVGVNLGSGDFEGLDIQGRYFYDEMVRNNVDMSEMFIHPDLPTAITFIYDKKNSERGGLAYFPNCNDDFDFDRFKGSIERLNPKVVYYMYSGLSERGDANEGKDLADFISWCRSKGAVSIVDSHTLTGNPERLIEAGESVEEYKLLLPLLGKLDLFFTSYDEARMIENTIGEQGVSLNLTEENYIFHFLNFLSDMFWEDDQGARIFGVTVSNGAIVKYKDTKGNIIGPEKIESCFMVGEVVDLVGAGDSFRAGLMAYISQNIDDLKEGQINFREAVQMGNLFASLYIKSPLENRYGNIKNYEKLFNVVKKKNDYNSFPELLKSFCEEPKS